MSIFLFLILLFGLQFLCFLSAEYSAKKMKGNDDYFLGGKQLSFFPLMMTCIATQVGGGLVLGAADEAYHYGWQVLFYPLGAALGMMVLGMGVGQRLAALDVPTVAQIFEKVYGSPLLKKGASLLSITSLFMILVAQFIASSKFMLGLGIESTWIFVGFWAIVIAYTSLGGFKAVVSTDLIQASFFIGAFILAFVWSVFFSDLSVPRVFESGLMKELPMASEKLVAWLLMPLFFILIEQDMAQRCFAADAPKTIKRAAICSGLCVLIICSIPVWFGIAARESGIVVESGASVLMTGIQTLTHPWIAPIVACAVLAAIISTADSLINAISSNLNQDFKFTLFGSNEVRSAQIATMVISVSGLACSFFFDSIVSMLIQSYELSISCLFISVFFALFKKKGHALSASLSIAFGGIAFVLFRFLSIDSFREIYSIGFSLGGYLIGEAIMALRGAGRAYAH